MLVVSSSSHVEIVSFFKIFLVPGEGTAGWRAGLVGRLEGWWICWRPHLPACPVAHCGSPGPQLSMSSSESCHFHFTWWVTWVPCFFFFNPCVFNHNQMSVSPGGFVIFLVICNRVNWLVWSININSAIQSRYIHSSP